MMAEEKKAFRTIHFINGASKVVPLEVVEVLRDKMERPGGAASFQSFNTPDKVTILVLNITEINYID